MAFCVLEDLQGECELIVFPSALEKLSPLLSEGAVLLVTGTAQLREAVSEDGEDELKLLVRTARRAEPDGTAAEAEKAGPHAGGGLSQNHRRQREGARRGARGAARLSGRQRGFPVL